MDFERADIKALFYDYPIETLMSMLENDLELKEDEYLKVLPLLMRWRDTNFTQTEDRLITDMLETSWDEESIIPDEIGNIYRPFLLVSAIANQLLCKHFDGDILEPRVQFENLFRWKDITSFVGEDLLTMAYMAQCDIQRRKESSIFLWSDTLHHNNEELNDILIKGLTDIHAHYNATADIFHFNWVNMVNSVRHKSGVSKIKHNQDLSVLSPKTKRVYSLKCICFAAAYLRMLFYKDFVNGDDSGVTLSDYMMVSRLLIDEPYVFAYQEELQKNINALCYEGLKMVDGNCFDYAILPSFEIAKNIKNINIVYQGERLILYKFFYKYFCGCPKALRLSPYFYLYIILKTRIRKEIVQINQFNGFENFEDYQNRKALFINNDDALANLWGRIVLQSTIETSNDYLEARITPWDLSVRFYNFKECIFVKRDFYKKTNKKLGFVVHFIKQKEMPTNEDSELNCRYASFRNELHSDIDRIIDIVTKPDGQNAVPIVGIDAASTEMFCRPEVFAHIYRYAREKRIYGRTYHVGEDFFDLVDGLRAIDEAIEFLELDNNSRIGHGLALSVDAKKYFEKRKHNIIMPKQNVLDCCVWLWMRCQEFDIQMSGDLEYFIQKESRKLYHDIGYDLDFDMWDYWQSMQMRGCDPIYAYQSNSASSIWIETAKQEKYIKNLEDSNAYRLFHRYHYEGKVKKEGKKRHSTQWPDSIVDIVSKLQEMMIRKIEQRGIAIECNPTSNIKIGYFDRYDEHPLITSFFPIDKWENPTYPLLRCSINTDDRGVFATSIYNEYSLIALALLKKEDKDTKKKLYNKISVYRYIEEIRIQSKNQRFVGKDGDLKTTESSNVRLKPLVWRDLDAHIDSASKEVKTVDVNVQLGLPERENAFVPIDNETNDVEKVDESKHVWCIDFGFEGIAWQRIWFERSEEFGSEWVIKDFVMPPSNRMFWVGPGKFQGNSEKALLCEIPIYGVNRDKNRNHQKDDSKKYQIGAGAVGTLRIYDDSGSKNWYIEFIPKQYQITYGIEDGPDWTSEDIKEDISNPFSVQEQLWMMNENYNPTYKYYVGIARKNGTTAHVKGLSKKVKEE